MECDRGKLASLGPIANSKFGVVRCDRVRIEGVGVGMGTHEIDRSECARFRTTRDSYPPLFQNYKKLSEGCLLVHVFTAVNIYQVTRAFFGIKIVY